jgi:hypothetical protein
MLKSNKNNARNKISQCVEFRSKKETAIPGTSTGKKRGTIWTKTF